MSSTELLTIDSSNALVLKAFLKALAQVDPFPQALQPKLKKLAIALAKGQTNLAVQLAEIAEENDSLNQLFQDERSRMVRLCESEGERPGRRTNQVKLDPKPLYLGNIAAEIFSSDFPLKSSQDSMDKIDKADYRLDPTTIIIP